MDGWAAGGMGQLSTMSDMCKFHHGLSGDHDDDEEEEDTFFFYGKGSKSLQQPFPFHIVVRDKSMLVWLQAYVLIITFSA